MIRASDLEVLPQDPDAARELGFQVILCHSDDDVKRETEDIHLLMHQRVAGLIVVPAHERNNDNIFRQLQKDKIPFVLIDKYLKGLRCNFVGTDDRAGAREAVSYLIKLGHRRIGHISGAPKASTTDERMAGYKEILIENGITIYPQWVVANVSLDKPGYATAKQLLQLKNNRPTAIFAASDLIQRFTTLRRFSVFRQNLLTASRISSAVRTQVKGFGSSFLISI